MFSVQGVLPQASSRSHTSCLARRALDRNCARSKSLKRGGKASWPTKRRAKAGMAMGGDRWAVNVAPRLLSAHCTKHPLGEASAGSPHGCWVSGESAPICTKGTTTPGRPIWPPCASASALLPLALEASKLVHGGDVAMLNAGMMDLIAGPSSGRWQATWRPSGRRVSCGDTERQMSIT